MFLNYNTYSVNVVLCLLFAGVFSELLRDALLRGCMASAGELRSLGDLQQCGQTNFSHDSFLLLGVVKRPFFQRRSQTYSCLVVEINFKLTSMLTEGRDGCQAVNKKFFCVETQRSVYRMNGLLRRDGKG